MSNILYTSLLIALSAICPLWFHMTNDKECYYTVLHTTSHHGTAAISECIQSSNSFRFKKFCSSKKRHLQCNQINRAVLAIIYHGGLNTIDQCKQRFVAKTVPQTLLTSCSELCGQHCSICSCSSEGHNAANIQSPWDF